MAAWWQAAAVTLIAYAAMCGSGWLEHHLHAVSWLSTMDGTTQAETLGLTDPVDFAAHAVVGSAGEEVILTAVVALLAAARRPAWQMYTIALVLRMVLYGYSGSLAAAAVLFTVVNIWLHTRTCQIVPIIAAHLAYNLTTSFGDPAWARDDHLTHGHRPLGLQHHRDPPHQDDQHHPAGSTITTPTQQPTR